MHALDGIVEGGEGFLPAINHVMAQPAARRFASGWWLCVSWPTTYKKSLSRTAETHARALSPRRYRMRAPGGFNNALDRITSSAMNSRRSFS